MVLSAVLNWKPWAPGTSKGLTIFWTKYAHFVLYYHKISQYLSIYMLHEVLTCMVLFKSTICVHDKCMACTLHKDRANFIVLVAEGCYAGIDTMFVFFFGFLLKGSLRLFSLCIIVSVTI
jgi:hypothetical protein